MRARRTPAALVLAALTLAAACGHHREARRAFGGFGEVAVSVNGHRPACALLAATEAQWERGLMGRRDLGRYDGMVFLSGADTDVAFYMRNTPLPLSVAWFAADGRLLGSTDMAPCGDRPDCPLYRSPAPYRYALEVERGGLARLGVRAGRRLVLGRSPCPP